MWQNHGFWSQPQLFSARNQPDLSPEPAKGFHPGKRAAGSQNVVREVHPDTGEVCVIFRFLHKDRGGQP
jgi:hypothetical protein